MSRSICTNLRTRRSELERRNQKGDRSQKEPKSQKGQSRFGSELESEEGAARDRVNSNRAARERMFHEALASTSMGPGIFGLCGASGLASVELRRPSDPVMNSSGVMVSSFRYHQRHVRS